MNRENLIKSLEYTKSVCLKNVYIFLEDGCKNMDCVKWCNLSAQFCEVTLNFLEARVNILPGVLRLCAETCKMCSKVCAGEDTSSAFACVQECVTCATACEKYLNEHY